MRLSARLAEWLAAGTPAALVRVARVAGSAPREAGAVMAVTAAETAGTIGGGALEHGAIAAARQMLADGGAAQELELPLGPDIGQCCGGRVALEIARATPEDVAMLAAAERAAPCPEVYIFGAGHVGQALTRALAPLPLRLTVADEREDWLAPLAEIAETRHTALPEALIHDARPGAAFVILTHDHALDFMLAEAALARGDAAYVGLIGSATKRATLASRLRAAGGPDIAALTCPIGAGPRDKRPEIIAAATAGDLAAVLF